MNPAEVSSEIARLLSSVRGLPEAMIREVSDFAEALGRKRTDADERRQMTIASLKRFESEHPDESWGEDLLNPEGTACSPRAM
jgi:hypothetical protein